MVVLLAELFLDGRLSMQPEGAELLADLLCRKRRAERQEELWSPWDLSERAGGLRARKIPLAQLPQLLNLCVSRVCLLGDANWNRIALESGRVEEIWIRWRPEFGDGRAAPFVSEFHPSEGARLPLRLLYWRTVREGGIIGRYAVIRSRQVQFASHRRTLVRHAG